MKHLREKNLKSKTAHLPGLEETLMIKYLTLGLNQVKSILIENQSTGMKQLHLGPPISEYIFSKKFHSLLYFYYSRNFGRI